jgi:ribosomal protein L11
MDQAIKVLEGTARSLGIDVEKWFYQIKTLKN